MAAPRYVQSPVIFLVALALVIAYFTLQVRKAGVENDDGTDAAVGDWIEVDFVEVLRHR